MPGRFEAILFAMSLSDHTERDAVGTASATFANRIRSKIFRSLERQGFEIRGGQLVPPDTRDKSEVRGLHQEAVRHNRARSRAGLERHEDRLLARVADGPEVVPEKVSPALAEVRSGSEEELLFRYARLHWSIPVSAGYGRRLRFVVYDESNDKLTAELALDVLGSAVDRKLLGELALFHFMQDSAPHYALGQITEIQLKNVWHEDPTMRSLIRQRGRVDAVSERQDTHLGKMVVSAVFQEGGSARYEPSILGTVPSTGTPIHIATDDVLNELLDPY